MLILHLKVHTPNNSSQDITKIQINGLGSTTYTDKVLNATEHTQTDPSIKIAGETDRVYKSIKQIKPIIAIHQSSIGQRKSTQTS
jgi:glucose-6-phosphate 1-epimerase